MWSWLCRLVLCGAVSVVRGIANWLCALAWRALCGVAKGTLQGGKQADGSRHVLWNGLRCNAMLTCCCSANLLLCQPPLQYRVRYEAYKACEAERAAALREQLAAVERGGCRAGSGGAVWFGPVRRCSKAGCEAGCKAWLSTLPVLLTPTLPTPTCPPCSGGRSGPCWPGAPAVWRAEQCAAAAVSHGSHHQQRTQV